MGGFGGFCCYVWVFVHTIGRSDPFILSTDTTRRTYIQNSTTTPGNNLRALPPAITELEALEVVSVEGNPLDQLPPAVAEFVAARRRREEEGGGGKEQ